MRGADGNFPVGVFKNGVVVFHPEFLVSEQAGQILPVHETGGGDACQGKDSGGNVGQGGHRVLPDAFLEFAGQAEDQGDPHGLVVDYMFVVTVVAAKAVAVVRGKDHQGILLQALLPEHFQNPANLPVHAGNQAVILGG